MAPRARRGYSGRMGAGAIRVGISGWNYAGWRRRFYPASLPHHQELRYASRRLSSIEVNGTFYSLKSPEVYESWRAQTPEDFVFSLKAPRYVTHILRLKGAETAIANFFANGLLRLGPKLGPLLWQLPPSLRFDPGRIEAFLRLLPRTTAEAAGLARRHDDMVAGRFSLATDGDRPLRHALEVRHESYRDPRFYDLLRRAGVALVVSDAARWQAFEELTASFAYARLHGHEELYVSGYGPRALRSWAEKIQAWSRTGRDAYVYFDNDAKVRAPFDALALERILGLRGAEARFRRPAAARRASARPRGARRARASA